jgi:hypothetical protein
MYRFILRFILLKMILPPFWDKVFHVRLLRHVLPPNYWLDFTKCWQVTFFFCLCPLNNRVCTGVHAGILICVYWTCGLLVPRRTASRRQFSPSRVCQLSALARGMESGSQKSEMCSSVKILQSGYRRWYSVAAALPFKIQNPCTKCMVLNTHW